MRKVDLFGQLSLFDELTKSINVSYLILEERDNNLWNLSKGEKLVNKVMEEGVNSYLKKEEKILSLLRERGKAKKFKQSCFMDCFNFLTYSKKKNRAKKKEYILSCVRNKFIVPALDNPEEKLPKFFLGFSDCINIKQIPDTRNEVKIVKSLLKKNESYKGSLEITFNGEENKCYMPIGSKSRYNKNQSGYKWKLGKYGNSVFCIDGPLYFARTIILFNLRDLIQQRLNGLSDSEKNDNIIYQMLITQQLSDLKEFQNESGVVKVEHSILEKDYVKKYLNENSIVYEDVYLDFNGKEIDISYSDVMQQGDFMSLFVMTHDVSPRDWIFRNDWKREGNTWVIDLSYGIRDKFLIKLFENVFEEYIFDIKEDEFRKNLSSEYAKSFQTKKYISEKVLRNMEQSGWNQYFGYVEFDEETDVKKVEELVKEFTALTITFGWKKKEDVSLRFRKLGNHKAVGLYYPNKKCLCVDIRYPSSMVHEYFHMLDDEVNASRGVKFYTVYSIYRDLIEKYAEKSGKEGVLNGKTKYNKEYYLQPTEVFARCGEMYLVKVKHVDNSLVNPKKGFAYPDDIVLMNAIKEYFDDFFKMKE